MKIKADYVTNSSSEVFAVVLQDTLVSAALIASAVSILHGFKVEQDHKNINEPVVLSLIDDAQTISRSIAKGVEEDALRQEAMVNDAYYVSKTTMDSSRSVLERELDETMKTDELAKATYGVENQEYLMFKKDCDEYQDYLNTQLQQVDARRKILADESTAYSAKLSSISEETRTMQTELIAVREEKAMLDGIAKGYPDATYDLDPVRLKLRTLEERDLELSGKLKSANAGIEYQAQRREAIKVSDESIRLGDELKSKQEEFASEMKRLDTEKRNLLKAETQRLKEIKSNLAKAKEAGDPDGTKQEINFSMQEGEGSTNAILEEYKRKSLDLQLRSEEEMTLLRKQQLNLNRQDLTRNAIENSRYGTEAAIDALPDVSQEFGMNLKLMYKTSKALAEGINAGKEDPKHAAKQIAKGILNASSEVLKDKLGFLPFSAHAVNALNNSLQNGLNASIKGENVLKALSQGLTKGIAEAGYAQGTTLIKEGLPQTDGKITEATDQTVSTLLNNNPLTMDLFNLLTKEIGGDRIAQE